MTTSSWSSATCHAHGIDIHYTRTGGTKPPVILLHGLMTNGLCWTGLARTLEQEFDVLMPDARGHGQSSAPPNGYSYPEQADDVAGLIRALGLSSPLLLGHSMGGMTAAVVASRYSQLLRGVVLADPTFLRPEVQREVWHSDVAEQHRKLLGLPLSAVIADARSRHPTRPQETIELFARARLQTSMRAFDVLRPPTPDYEQMVASIGIPCLLIFGDGGLMSPGVAHDLQRLNPFLQVEQIAGAATRFR